MLLPYPSPWIFRFWAVTPVLRGELGLRGHEWEAEGENIMRHTNALCVRSLLELGECDGYVLGSRRLDAS